MSYDKDLITHKLQRWDKYITDYHLPEWDAIPNFGLYMDQVIGLLEDYLNFIPSDEKNKFVTASTINNYVRLKIMPAPIKRKYYRIHIAYLIFILVLKQTLSISDVQKLVPLGISEDRAQDTYSKYTDMFRRLALFFNQQVQSAADEILSSNADVNDAVDHLLVESTLISAFAKIMAEKLIYLIDVDAQEALAAEK